MNTEEAKALLKDRGVSIMHMPDGYIVTVSRREGSPSEPWNRRVRYMQTK